MTERGRLDEMVETFEQAINDLPVTSKLMSLNDFRKVGLNAVLRKHIEPMIAEAFNFGNVSAYAWIKDGVPEVAKDDYAARIISHLTEPKP